MEAAEASSTPAGVETPLSALLFCELFSCAYIAKRKAANSFVLFNELFFCNRICQYSEKQTAMSAFLFTKIKEYMFLDGNRSKSIDFLGSECYNKL